jgi:Zn-finger nucleic acid-binding protein
MPRLCPDCQQPLRQETFQNIQLDSCSNCAGFWFDSEELGRVMRSDPLALIALEEEHLPHVQARPGANTHRRCPDCQALLERYQYLYDSPITLDSCGNCAGVWIEDGELQKIQQWLDQHTRPTKPGARQETDLETTMAHISAEHEREMGRLSKMRGLCTLLSQRRVW